MDDGRPAGAQLAAGRGRPRLEAEGPASSEGSFRGLFRRPSEGLPKAPSPSASSLPRPLPRPLPKAEVSSHAAHLQYSHAKTQRPPMASRPRRKPPTPEKSSAKVKRGGGGVTGGGVAAASSVLPLLVALASISQHSAKERSVKKDIPTGMFQNTYIE